ncbi:hypothetical protein GCM10027445_47050 [Amycolatopsis endophytica]|uniref:DNA integrity scanning protein DisA with diadenylate cyclase activity n=1 Tax=Amycolatopsis endophytica TaxID=860233 RepID=A0A853BCU5_9PSEU|nr:hypothetical protein [Amycolatopsis endophytica]NYI92477.1 DNA integrity scanning protein DisA with diadenylate cyclase activity [Amycolatopsis endophytica]
MVVHALPRRLSLGVARTARAGYRTLASLPRIATALTELRDAAKHLERLATFAAEELPEIVYQLEGIREQLAAIENRLGGRNGQEPVTPAARRSGSRPPS